MLLFEVLEVVEGTTKKRRKIEQKYLNQIQDWATIYNIKKKTVERFVFEINDNDYRILN